MERRQSTRIPFKAAAYLVHNGRSFASEIRDISRHGMFITAPGAGERGETTSVSIVLQHGRRRFTITLPCSVVRVSDSGLGCHSEQLEPEVLLFISNLLHARGKGPAEFLQAYYGYFTGHDLPATC